MKKDDILSNLEKLPEITKNGKMDGKKSYLYRKNSVKEPLSGRIGGEWKDKMERQSHAFGVSMNEILEAILGEYYKDKDFPPIEKKKFVI